MILEPGQRKLIRVAAITASPDHEHVYRVTVKPVVGAIQANESGLKIMVGYDVLVLVRPVHAAPNVTAVRTGSLHLRQQGQCQRRSRRWTPVRDGPQVVHRAAREAALPRRVVDARIAFRAAGRIYAPITRPRRSEGILTMRIGAARRILGGVDFMIGAVRRLLEGRSFQSDEPVETRRELSGRYLREL